MSTKAGFLALDAGTPWRIAGIYLLLVQPILLFVVPLIRYDEFRLGTDEPLFGLTVSIDAWRNFFITVYGIWAGLMIWQNSPNAARTAHRSIVISLVSAFALLILPFLIPFHSPLRKEIRVEQAVCFLQALGAFIIWLIYISPWKNSTNRGSNVQSLMLIPSRPLWKASTFLGGAIAVGTGLTVAIVTFSTQPIDIFEAAWNGDLKAVEKFLKAGVDVNTATWNENSPLHIARTKELAEYLLSVRCPVDIRNSLRETPLHLAALDGRAEVSLVLVEHGAEVNATNRNGLTPLDHALFGKGRKWKGDYDTVIALLASRGGKTGADVQRDLKSGQVKTADELPSSPRATRGLTKLLARN